ncbi:MAG TPA: response regulator [Candidatus Limnocylindria bacterium]|nr:response regulator [Candidatus Limnocylindria bacterium]
MGTVVFVEDDATIRKLVQVALKSTAHAVHFASNGREGLALVERVRPDVVFTDVAMPEMDGLQLADALHARPDLADIPIVFVTASLQREQIERYFAHGARTYLAKPFSTAELRAQVDALVGAKL